MNASTLGSRATMAAAARWCSTIDAKEMSCGASTKPMIRPVSSLGRNPFGIATKR